MMVQFAVTWAQTKYNSREGIDWQRRPQEERKDSIVSISFCVGLVVKVPRMETVFVQKRNHIRKVQTGSYMFVEFLENIVRRIG